MPPPTDEERHSVVLRCFEDIQNRKPKFGVDVAASRVLPEPAPWAVYPLDEEGYRDLLQRIEQDEDLAGYVDDKLKLDYFPRRRRFILRGPTTLVHGMFISSLNFEIQKQLDSFSGPSWAFAQSIYGVGSATIYSKDTELGMHAPDGQFRHSRAQFPGIVIEIVLCSQKKRDVRHLADEYILGSGASIQAVVELDIRKIEGKGMLATWSLYEPAIEEGRVLVAKQTVKNQIFRTATGTSSNDALEISLRSFAPSGCYPLNLPPQGNITIPAHTLCAWLQKGEEIARRRDITPEDDLLERHEEKV